MMKMGRRVSCVMIWGLVKGISGYCVNGWLDVSTELLSAVLYNDQRFHAFVSSLHWSLDLWKSHYIYKLRI